MSPSDLADLGELQRWFCALVTHPSPYSAAAPSPREAQRLDASPAAIEAIVARSDRQSSQERLAVYQRGYRLRLLECMRARYPALRHALGSELFEQFALDYLEAHPSDRYTLLSLDRHFAEHLAATRPDAADAVESGEPWPDFIVDLARLERLVAQIFDGPGLERQQPPGRPNAPVPPIEPDPSWADVIVEPSPSLGLLTSSYPIGRYLLAVYRGQDPVLPLPEPTFLALGRCDYVVQLNELTEASFVVLTALLSGETLNTATQRGALPVDGEAWAWFRGWVQSGLFAALSIPGHTTCEQGRPHG